jgi:DNA-directed RNA polymerase subunit RPC12/RpoP
MGLTHLGCPSCGGTLSLAEGERIVVCRYCGSRNLVLVPGATPRYVLSLGVSREEAAASARAALQRSGVPRVLRERVRFKDILLCYIPFYESSAVRLGTVFLRELVKPVSPEIDDLQDDDTMQRWLNEPPVEKEDTKVVEQDAVRHGPACDLPELGVECIKLAELRQGATKVPLEPFDPVALQGRAVVFGPTKPSERFAEESTWRLRSTADRTGFVEQQVKLLYYPVWQVRYLHRGRSYDIAVDGISGVLLRGHAPRTTEWAAALAVGGLALTAFGAGRIARLLFLPHASALARTAGNLESLILLALAGAAGIFLARLGWKWFQQGGEQLLEGETR